MDIMSNLYQQKAAEYKALCLQAYNLAQQNVADSIKAKRKTGLPLAEYEPFGISANRSGSLLF